MIVVLERYELLMAAEVGLRRQIAPHRRETENYVGNKNFGWHTDIEGACAELAVAKALGVYWDGSVFTDRNADFRRPDVGGTQVRHTDLQHGSLVLRPRDKDEQPYVLVIGEKGSYRIPGWMVARDGKKAEYLDPSPPGYWKVPQKKLRPLSEYRP